MRMSPRWTGDDIPDQGGRLAIVTGANSGIGFFIARDLARAGAHVILAVRDAGKGVAAAEGISSGTTDAHAHVARLDLAELGSVRAFAERISSEHERVDLLINNAGVMAVARARTADGFEMQFGTNHLGHFALTGLLLPRLLTTPDARVVTVSSINHRAGRMNFDDLQGERRYSRWGAYNQSKLANLLFVFELDRRLRASGASLRSIAAHPGYSATNLQHGTPSPFERVFFPVGNRLIAQSAEMGALPVLYAATMPDVRSGAYVGPRGFGEVRGYPGEAKSTRSARDPLAARRLWEESEGLTGVTYEPLLPAAS
jgi:NAD(P)-dependent dehydrogenase (short-subunit alcohol dehydrogenase family)